MLESVEVLELFAFLGWLTFLGPTNGVSLTVCDSFEYRCFFLPGDVWVTMVHLNWLCVNHDVLYCMSLIFTFYHVISSITTLFVFVSAGGLHGSCLYSSHFKVSKCQRTLDLLKVMFHFSVGNSTRDGEPRTSFKFSGTIFGATEDGPCRITLVDRTAEVLPLLPPDAQDYARKWLDAKGLDLRLGDELPLEQQQLLKALNIDEALVLPCAGVRFPGGQLVAKLGAGDPTGQICTNRAMQCVREGGKKGGEQIELWLLWLLWPVFEQMSHFRFCFYSVFLNYTLIIWCGTVQTTNITGPGMSHPLSPPLSKIDNVVTSSYIGWKGYGSKAS